MKMNLEKLTELRNKYLIAQNELSKGDAYLTEARTSAASLKADVDAAFKEIHKDELAEEARLLKEMVSIDEEIRAIIIAEYETRLADEIDNKKVAVGAGVAVKYDYKIRQPNSKELLEYVKENFPTFLVVDTAKYLALAKAEKPKVIDVLDETSMDTHVEFVLEGDAKYVDIQRSVSARITEPFWSAEDLELKETK
jgi:hypothetical protein